MCICKIIKNKDIMLEYNIGIVYSMYNICNMKYFDRMYIICMIENIYISIMYIRYMYI